MGNSISRTNRGRFDDWTSTTMRRTVFIFVGLVTSIALLTAIGSTIYAIICYGKGGYMARRSEPPADMWTSFGNAAQRNHVKRSTERGSATVVQTPDSTVPGVPAAQATTTSAVEDGRVVTYVYYSPRTWLTLAAVPYRSAVPYTRHGDTVDYNMSSWTEHRYTRVQALMSSFQTETLSGPVTVGADGVVGTAAGSLEGVPGAAVQTVDAMALPGCVPSGGTGMVVRQPGEHSDCMYPRPAHATPTQKLEERGAASAEPAAVTEAASDIADFWIPTVGPDESVAATAEPAAVTEAASDIEDFWIPTVGLGEGVAAPTESAAVTEAPSDLEAFWIPTAGLDVRNAAPTESAAAAVTEAPLDPEAFWIPTARLGERDAAPAVSATAVEPPSDPEAFWIPTAGLDDSDVVVPTVFAVADVGPFGPGPF